MTSSSNISIYGDTKTVTEAADRLKSICSEYSAMIKNTASVPVISSGDIFCMEAILDHNIDELDSLLADYHGRSWPHTPKMRQSTHGAMQRFLDNGKQRVMVATFMYMSPQTAGLQLSIELNKLCYRPDMNFKSVYPGNEFMVGMKAIKCLKELSDVIIIFIMSGDIPLFIELVNQHLPADVRQKFRFVVCNGQYTPELRKTLDAFTGTENCSESDQLFSSITGYIGHSNQSLWAVQAAIAGNPTINQALGCEGLVPDIYIPDINTDIQCLEIIDGKIVYSASRPWSLPRINTGIAADMIETKQLRQIFADNKLSMPDITAEQLLLVYGKQKKPRFFGIYMDAKLPSVIAGAIRNPAVTPDMIKTEITNSVMPALKITAGNTSLSRHAADIEQALAKEYPEFRFYFNNLVDKIRDLRTILEY